MNKTKVSLWILYMVTFGYWLIVDKQTYNFEDLHLRKPTKNKSKPIKKSIVANGRKYDGPEKYAFFHQAIRTGVTNFENLPNDQLYPAGYQRKALIEARSRYDPNRSNRRTKSLNFTERGPVNVPGRTRALLIDPTDITGNTWFAGSVSGGIWKTNNAGQLWSELTEGLPNIAFTTMDMPTSNPNVIYAGTGEGSYGGLSGVNGNGIFKSIDNGNTWVQLESTDNDEFINVSRIIVNPDDENEVIACTTNYAFRNSRSRRSFIFKSTDGGDSWQKVFTSTKGKDVQHLVATPGNFSTIYASVNGIGIYKSIDSGNTWMRKSSGLVTSNLTNPRGLLSGDSFGRLEIAVSPNNTDIIYVSVEGTASEVNSDLYVSFDAAENWNLIVEEGNASNPNWLRGQGWYDNTIAVHPFNDSILYVGGVDTWKMQLKSPRDTTSQKVIDFEFNNIDTFADIVNIFSDEGEEVVSDDYLNLEVRFGPGLSQKAHRFTVPGGSSASVPKENYTYRNYIDVPFEVWDIENNRQLMVSFRDNLNNGSFSLTDNFDTSREYIYVHALPYSEIADENITRQGGHLFKSLYQIWLNSTEGVSWDANNLPNASILLTINDVRLVRWERNSQVIADVYDDFDGPNTNVHPDQHNLIMMKGEGESFRILNANDGGIYVTDFDQDPGTREGSWKEAGNTYNTTQFYGVDKMPDQDRYIGGTQDNGTWISVNSSDDASASYTRVIGGDGFETVWHYKNPKKIIGGAQNNFFLRTLDGWETAELATRGLKEDGPFVSRLANSKSDPDRLFTVGSSGVYRSDDFGGEWTSIPIVNLWGFWSGIDIEISLANPQIVWAGGGMSAVRSIHLSTDGGYTFNPTTNFPEEIGVATGIYSHPFQDSTVYVLFSVNQRPKVLRTTDLGQSWQDISGFSTESTSTGFPNVAVYSLLVMPHDTNILWAGTEIGIIESIDNGQNWQLLESNFPAVSVWDMKVVDDQVIIATHGRGIWTVTIPELEDAWKPEDVILTPLLFSASQAIGTEQINIDVELRSDYDSIQVIGNNELLSTIKDNFQKGRGTITISKATPGLLSLQIIGFKDNKPFVSTALDVTIAVFVPPVKEYATNFNSLNNDFLLDGFLINQQDDFDNANLHTEHPYPTANEKGESELDFTAILSFPIIVEDENAFIRYNEVVIVEPGEEGTTFGDTEFWDYVIVEGTKDGFNWLPLVDGYDSRLNGRWQNTYDNEDNGTSSMFINNELNILETFQAGDTIQVRFRLYSDPFDNGWGWAIDNLQIQTEKAVTSINTPEIANKVSLYPNPGTGVYFIEVSNVLKGTLNVSIINILGKEIYTQELSNPNGYKNFTIDISNQPKGSYILRVSNGEDAVTKRLILQ